MNLYACYSTSRRISREICNQINANNVVKKNNRSILNFIREKEHYHIIGSIIWGLSINIGNHGAYLFPEFQLGSSYKAD